MQELMDLDDASKEQDGYSHPQMQHVAAPEH
jgi:hypothetical protein